MTTDGLPSGWATVQVRELVSLVNGFPFKPAQWKGSGLPIIRIQNLNNPDAAFNYCPDPIPEKFRVRGGDLLFAWSGTPGTSFGAHIWRGEDAWLNQHIFRVGFDEQQVDSRFLQLSINQNLNEYIAAAHGGAGLAHITKGKFEDSRLLIAPLAEQRRIVEKVEELFSDLDAGVAALERVRKKLTRYRSAVLHAAVTGRLTAAWRALHGPPSEPGPQLLQRILAERRRQWEERTLARYARDGRQPPNGWRDRYPQPAEPNSEEQPELPAGWCWTCAEQLCSSVENGNTPAPEVTL